MPVVQGLAGVPEHAPRRRDPRLIFPYGPIMVNLNKNRDGQKWRKLPVFWHELPESWQQKLQLIGWGQFGLTLTGAAPILREMRISLSVSSPCDSAWLSILSLYAWKILGKGQCAALTSIFAPSSNKIVSPQA
jgi:hypothetical protein